jgi:hypothetical protein
MKNTKKMVSSGITLAFSLFASVQTFTMDPVDALTTRIERLETNLTSMINTVSKLDDQTIQEIDQKKIKDLLAKIDNFVLKNEYVATTNLIVEQINEAGKLLDVILNLFVEVGILTLPDLQQRIRQNTDKAIGLKMIQ